jgi:hypothetical protein
MSIIEKKETTWGTFLVKLRPIVKEDLIVYASNCRLHVTNMDELTGIGKYCEVSTMLAEPAIKPGPNMEKRRQKRMVAMLGNTYDTPKSIEWTMPQHYVDKLLTRANTTVDTWVASENRAAKRNALERMTDAGKWVTDDFPALVDAIERADIEYKLAQAKLAAAKDMLHKKALDAVIKDVKEKGAGEFISEAEIRAVVRGRSIFGGV